jgi:uncharacterized MAPEG superfamily protein|mmetsp:Transcript_86335/g.143626  ORF Transcript_86335/g.143626 Transcript_86335/m.143626 type:complete len:182 (-) Transcript_86335:518-1063(-)|eukprot:CAMPEP_0174285554 /NCGR_PEP_ID=MMETSP0809-20121228/8936_1 /TAXON_ID=73025 ORGANISM="Eutreptiella gymnastica-like, Strain CCMP1594" /NCGR_SAMPLE_ID=MMETSP0809 /ASSEMBLY_ACC=CAM_ASM_000658 /LENGTH=181 /DNA_ID=CAMNT_0015381359 /DNA_START=29 /DNA_END=574 /DNA_ORIENTATION=-
MANVPPHGIAFVPLYLILGAIASFAFGRAPGTMPADWFGELKLPALASSAFIVCYSLLDVLGVGRAKAKHDAFDKAITAKDGELPEEVCLALRAQANQVEQMSGFFVALWMYSFFVSGPAGGAMGSAWVILRVLYSATYRNSAGIAMAKKGLLKFTVPCYFLLNAMAMGTAIHVARLMFSA